MTEIKIFQLCCIMRKRKLAFICLQETRICTSGGRIVENDHLLITSGNDDGKRTCAGVGFLVAPWVRRSVFSFKAISDRICYIKLRIYGGKLTTINTYAPHGGYEYDKRQEHFSELQSTIESSNSHGLKVVT